ncbi:hypothetical protein BJY52DRAFT_1193291 [Lactarius psammicola]|nr:hypothetical protein BJY52DRAFT_1193291 [Lactarius psammicola]
MAVGLPKNSTLRPFNGMHVSLSSGRSRNPQLPTIPYNRDGSSAPTPPHHQLQPSPSLLTSNPEIRPHTSAAHIHPNSSRLYITQLAAPDPASASLLPLRPTPGGSSTSMSTTIHAAPPGPTHPPICRRLSPPLTLPPPPAPPKRSYL